MEVQGGEVKQMNDVYRVTWKDAEGGARIGWRDIEELMSGTVAIAVSIGVLLVNDEEKIILCPHFLPDEKGNPEQGDAEIVIPRQWVVKMEKLT